MIRPCDACGGFYYDGYPCRTCDRLQVARHVAVQAVRMLQAVRDTQPVAGLMHDESAWDTDLLAPLERAIETWEEMP